MGIVEYNPNDEVEELYVRAKSILQDPNDKRHTPDYFHGIIQRLIELDKEIHSGTEEDTEEWVKIEKLAERIEFSGLGVL